MPGACLEGKARSSSATLQTHGLVVALIPRPTLVAGQGSSGVEDAASNVSEDPELPIHPLSDAESVDAPDGEATSSLRIGGQFHEGPIPMPFASTPLKADMLPGKKSPSHPPPDAERGSTSHTGSSLPQATANSISVTAIRTSDHQSNSEDELISVSGSSGDFEGSEYEICHGPWCFSISPT
jgi:hypothetical protein